MCPVENGWKRISVVFSENNLEHWVNANIFNSSPRQQTLILVCVIKFFFDTLQAYSFMYSFNFSLLIQFIDPVYNNNDNDDDDRFIPQEL